MTQYLPRPPLVKGDPILGSLRAMLKSPHHLMMNAYKQCGPAFRIRVPGRELTAMAGMEAIRFTSGEGKTALSSKGFIGTAAKHMGCPNMILATDGEPHMVQRNTVKQILNPMLFRDRIEEFAEGAGAILHQSAGADSAEVGPVLRQIISNQIGFALQGYKTSYKEVKNLIYYFGGFQNVYGLGKWPAFMLYTPKFLRAKAAARRHAQSLIGFSEQRDATQQQNHPLYLDRVLKAMSDSPFPFTQGDRDIHTILPFVLALDTVASTLGFMLERIINEPHWLQILQPAADELFASGTPSFDEIRQDHALMAFARETLRIQPTAPGMARIAAQDFEFSGFQYLAGDKVMIFTTSEHQNPDYFPQPDRFDIQRYMGERKEHRQPAYAPFAKGPHACLGVGLTEILLPMNLGLILRHYLVKPACDMKKVRIVWNPAPVLSDNFQITLQPRIH